MPSRRRNTVKSASNGKTTATANLKTGHNVKSKAQPEPEYTVEAILGQKLGVNSGRSTMLFQVRLHPLHHVLSYHTVHPGTGTGALVICS